MSVDGGGSSIEVQVLRDELTTLYKQKNKNDQDLIEANRKLGESEGRLVKVVEERDKLKADRERLCARIAELEHSLKKTTDEKNTVYDEWLALNAYVKSQTDQLTRMKSEEMQLINKIRELNEQKANYMNEEVAQQSARQQKRIQDDIAKAIADTSRDERANSTLSQCNGPVGDTMLGDRVPAHVESKFEANEGEILDVRWLSADTFATAGSDKKARLWKVESNGKPSKLSTLTGCVNSITRLDYDSESRCLIGSSNDHAVRLWNIDTQRITSTFSGHSDKVTVARFHQTSQVVSGSSDRSIKVWDLRSQRCSRTFFPGSTIHDMIGHCPMGSAAFISGHFDKKIRLWDGRTNEAVQIVEMAGKITSLDMAADGQNMLCSTRDDTLSLIDVRTLRTVHIYSSEQYRTSSDFSRCVLSPGMEYCAAGSSDGHVFVWNVRTTKLEKCLSKGGHEHPVLSVHWNPCGRGLLSGDKQKSVVLWT